MFSGIDDHNVREVINVELFFKSRLLSSFNPQPSPLFALVNFDHILDELNSVISALSLVIQNVREESNGADLNKIVIS